MPVTLAIAWVLLFFLLDDLVELRFVLGLAAGTGRIFHYARRFRLANTVAGVGFDRFCGRKSAWLAFGHGLAFPTLKVEYGIDSA